MINNPKITDQSLIYITPISDTANKVLFVKSKQANIICEENESECVNKDGWFKIAIDMPINQEIKFNWWIIN